MGVFFFIINLPLIIWVKRKKNKSQLKYTLVGLLFITGMTLLLHPHPPLSEHPLVASMVGGIILGGGIGLIIRFGGYADGIQLIAILLKRRIRLSLSELVMIINLTILLIGGFILGWEQALYSGIAYFIAYKMLHFALMGHHRLVMVWIKGKDHEDLKEKMTAACNGNITFMKNKTVRNNSQDMFAIVSSEHKDHIQTLLKTIDPTASIEITPFIQADADEYLYK
ncbi:hypothetical protein D3C73_1110660 [compost metagenome]